MHFDTKKVKLSRQVSFLAEKPPKNRRLPVCFVLCESVLLSVSFVILLVFATGIFVLIILSAVVLILILILIFVLVLVLILVLITILIVLIVLHN